MNLVSPTLYFSGLHQRLSDLYTCNCPNCKKERELILLSGESKEPEFKGVLNAFSKAVKYLHSKGNYKPEDLKEKPYQNLIKKTRKVLGSALKDNDIPPAMLAKLQQDIFIFSGLKTHAELVEASRLLLDDKGRIKSFPAFAKDIDKLNTTYNRNYLEAEYQFAVTSSQMAANWEGLEESDRYNLQYRTAGDEKVRKEHQELNGITLPKSDPFWIKYYPPNGWNCRCLAIQVLAGKYPVSDSEKVLKLGEKATTQINKDGKNTLELFRFNPGLQSKVFPPGHPYSKVQEANKAKEVLESDLSKFKNRYQFTEFKPTEGITKGKLEVFTTGKQHKFEFKKNKEALKILADKGAQYRMLPVIEDGNKNPDAYNLVKKWFSDIKVGESTNGKNVVQMALKEASRQKVSEVVIRFTKEPKRRRDIYEALSATFGQGRAKNIKNVVFILPDKRVIEVNTQRFKNKGAK